MTVLIWIWPENISNDCGKPQINNQYTPDKDNKVEMDQTHAHKAHWMDTQRILHWIETLKRFKSKDIPTLLGREVLRKEASKVRENME